MKKVLFFLILLLLCPLVAWAGAYNFNTITMSTNSGQTMGGRADTGVSLVGVIDNMKFNSVGYYSVQLGTLTFGRGADTWVSGVSDNADPGGTGIAADTGASIYIVYGLSNTELTTAQWEDKGKSGTTAITYHTVGSGSSDEPVPFSATARAECQSVRFVGIFVRSSVSQFLVPEVTTVSQ